MFANHPKTREFENEALGRNIVTMFFMYLITLTFKIIIIITMKVYQMYARHSCFMMVCRAAKTYYIQTPNSQLGDL